MVVLLRRSSDEVTCPNGIKLRIASGWDVLGVVEVYVLDSYESTLIRPGATVIDLGAGIGDFTIMASRLVGAGGKVIAVEPNPSDCEQLSENVRLNDCSNVWVLNAGLGRDGSISTSTFKDHKFAYVERSLRSIMANFHLHRIDFLKVDIEGGEARLANYNLATDFGVKAIAIELHGNQDELRSGLERAGFVFHRLSRARVWLRTARFLMAHPRLSAGYYARLRSALGRSLLGTLLRGPNITKSQGQTVGVFIYGPPGK